jgi:hypothetical protein
MRRLTTGLAVTCTAFALLLAAAIARGDDAPRPVAVDTANLHPAPGGEAVAPAAVFHPAPSPAQQLQAGLEDIQTRRDADLAELRARIAATAGDERSALERQLQLRKLDAEIETFELQINLTGHHAAAAGEADPSADAMNRLQASVARLHELRDRIEAGGPATMPQATPPAREE